jgi:hypothetical protein
MNEAAAMRQTQLRNDAGLHDGVLRMGMKAASWVFARRGNRCARASSTCFKFRNPAAHLQG